MTRAGVGLGLLFLYAASIGPLAGLEAHEYGNPKFWRGLKPVYFPIFWSWKYGPEPWARTLKTYTRLFHVRQGCLASQRYYFASNNDADAYRQLQSQFRGEKIEL